MESNESSNPIFSPSALEESPRRSIKRVSISFILPYLSLSFYMYKFLSVALFHLYPHQAADKDVQFRPNSRVIVEFYTF